PLFGNPPEAGRRQEAAATVATLAEAPQARVSRHGRERSAGKVRRPQTRNVGPGIARDFPRRQQSVPRAGGARGPRGPGENPARPPPPKEVPCSPTGEALRV